MRVLGIIAAAALSLAATATVPTLALAETIKIGFIEGLSGPFARTGAQGEAHFKFAAEEFFADGDNKVEIVSFDNKTSPKESLIQLQVAIDQGIRIVTQGNSSGVANAITDAVKKHNRRNPDDKVLYLNYSAVDPALTNDKCQFYHFRFDANADIKMDALTDVMAKDDSIKKVYLIGQDYSFGKAVAAAAVSMLKEKRPDIEIVGNELHPIGKVKDFTPYARKIVGSEADAVITGNWGSDMLGLAKAIIGSGYKKPIFTYYAASDGITKTLGADGKGIVRVIAEGQQNPPPSDTASDYYKKFKAKYPDYDLSQPRIANVMRMLRAAVDKAGSTDVDAVALAMEDMEMENFWGGTIKMRKQDHQLIQDVFVMEHTDENMTFPYDNSEFGIAVESKVENAAADAPTTCEMDNRPT